MAAKRNEILANVRRAVREPFAWPGRYPIYVYMCATCHAGGSVRHKIPEDADKAAVRDSGKACKACGAS